jgi:hypothetical protein
MGILPMIHGLEARATSPKAEIRSDGAPLAALRAAVICGHLLVVRPCLAFACIGGQLRQSVAVAFLRNGALGLPSAFGYRISAFRASGPTAAATRP